MLSTVLFGVENKVGDRMEAGSLFLRVTLEYSSAGLTGVTTSSSRASYDVTRSWEGE